MNKKIAYYTVISLSFGVATNAMAKNNEAMFCHITNAGFYITDGMNGVLIDAILDEGLDGFKKPNPALEGQMEAGSGEFENVGVVIATHSHYDHFNPTPILNHMKANPKSQYILTPESYEILKKTGLQTGPENTRFHTTMPSKENGSIHYEINNIGVDVFYVSHGEGRDIENIGVKITMGGKTYFHTGDIFWNAEGLAKSGISHLEIDYLLIPFWYPLDPDRKEELTSAFNFKNIVPMHLPLEGVEQPWMKQFGGYDGMIKAVFEQYENTIKLPNEMDCKVIK